MAGDYNRTRRIGEMIQRELAVLIQREVKDPRLQRVSIADVRVSKDLSLAKVYYTIIDTLEGEALEQAKAEVEQGLDKASSFLRYQLGQRIIIRNVPRLHFLFDDSVLKGTSMSRLIDNVIADDKKRMHHDDEYGEEHKDE